jgi:hypothetical protein
MVLYLHLGERTREPPDHGLVRNFVNFDANNYTEIEHKLIALILLIVDADGVAKDPVSVFRITDCDISIAEGLPWDDILGYRLKVKQTRFIDVWFWNNAPWRTLVNDSCP